MISSKKKFICTSHNAHDSHQFQENTLFVLQQLYPRYWSSFYRRYTDISDGSHSSILFMADWYTCSKTVNKTLYYYIYYIYYIPAVGFGAPFLAFKRLPRQESEAKVDGWVKDSSVGCEYMLDLCRLVD